MKLGISLKIDVTKIDKNRLFQGKNGAKYLDLTTFVDLDNPGQYGDHGFISQNVSKEERDQGIKGAILGNSKVFYNDNQTQQAGGFQPQQPQQQPKPSGFTPNNISQQMAQPQAVQQNAHPNQSGGVPMPDFDDDIPF